MRPTSRFVRRTSGVLLVVWLGVLAGVLVQRQIGTRRTIVEQPVEGSTSGETGKRPVRTQRGVVYQSTIGAEPSFRIAADEAVEFDTGWAELSNVQLSLYSQGEVAYGVVASRARFNPQAREAETVGESILSLQGGIALRAPGFTVKGSDRLVHSNGLVSFAGPGWGGLADHATAYLADNVLELKGNVTVSKRGAGARPESAVVILAPSLLYQRRQAAVMLMDGATLLQGPMRVTSPRVAVLLTGIEGGLRKIIMAPPVRIDGQLTGGSVVDIEAGDTVVDVIEGGRLRLTAAALAPNGWLTVQLADAATGVRTVQTWWLVGEGTGEAWEWLEGQGRVCATELVPGAEARSAEAGRARIDFTAGQASMLTAHDQVHLAFGEYNVDGGVLTYSLPTTVLTLEPKGKERVSLAGPDVQATCNRIETLQDGTLAATGDVVGSVRTGASLSAPDTPVAFAADAAVVPAGAEKLTLKGNARLWQQDRLLRADQIEVERATEVLTGQGNVITSAHNTAEGGSGEVVVKARQVRYDRGAGEAVFEGDAVLTDAQGQASCQKLVLFQAAEGEVKLITMEGGVSIKQPGTGRVLTGEKAKLVVAEDLFEMWGKPVMVQEAKGNQVTGAHLLWRRRQNTVVVYGSEDSPTQTLYKLEGESRDRLRKAGEATPTPAPPRATAAPTPAVAPGAAPKPAGTGEGS